MAILDVNDQRGTITDRCDYCGVSRDLALDPAKGDLRVAEQAVMFSPCPTCLARYDLTTISGFDRFLLPHEEGAHIPHPESLVGTRIPLGNGLESVVIEHTVAGGRTPEECERVRLIRQAQRHPHLAPHAPLAETLPPAAIPPHKRRWHAAWWERHQRSQGSQTAQVAALNTTPAETIP